MEKWLRPVFDLSDWQFFDLSCVSRDDTEDQVLRDAVAAGAPPPLSPVPGFNSSMVSIQANIHGFNSSMVSIQADIRGFNVQVDIQHRKLFLEF